RRPNSAPAIRPARLPALACTVFQSGREGARYHPKRRPHPNPIFLFRPMLPTTTSADGTLRGQRARSPPGRVEIFVVGGAVTDYTIEQGLGVRDRMDLLAAVFAPSTLALLDAVGVPAGARGLACGCGRGDVPGASMPAAAAGTSPWSWAVGSALPVASLGWTSTPPCSRWPGPRPAPGDSTTSAFAWAQSRTWRSPASTSPVPACSSCTSA